MTIPHDLRGFVFEKDAFESPAFCRDLITRAHDMGFQAAPITSETGTGVMPDIRNNDRVIFDDPDLASALWKKARALFSEPFKGNRAMRLNDRFRAYRYRPGQFFDWHQDGTYADTDGQRSVFTMMLYLNDGYEGGGTSFADVFSPHVFRDFTIAPRLGKALFFHHPLSHRGDPVVRGAKYVLRTDVMFAQDDHPLS